MCFFFVEILLFFQVQQKNCSLRKISVKIQGVIGLGKKKKWFYVKLKKYPLLYQNKGNLSNPSEASMGIFAEKKYSKV